MAAHLPDRPHRLETLDREECLRLLSSQSVGRVGISIGALPAVLPVNFGLLGDSIVFSTGAGTKLEAATTRAVVAFEVDAYEPDGQSGWSVLVVGRSSILPGDQTNRAQALGIAPWTSDGQASSFVRVQMTRATGRRLNR